MFICGMVLCGIFWGAPGAFGWAFASFIVSLLVWLFRNDD